MSTIQLLKSKIHRATVTKADLNYDGSITIPPKLLIKSKIREYEKVLVVNISNGQRFETYAIIGPDDNEICLNGAAARLGVVGDKVIIMAFTFIDDNTVRMRIGNSLINAKFTYYDSFKQESCGYIPQMPFEDEYSQLVPYDD